MKLLAKARSGFWEEIVKGKNNFHWLFLTCPKNSVSTANFRLLYPVVAIFITVSVFFEEKLCLKYQIILYPDQIHTGSYMTFLGKMIFLGIALLLFK